MRAESPRRAAESGPWPVLGLMGAVILAWGLIVALALRSGAVPPEAGGKLFVLFRPGTSETTAFAAILGAGGAPVRSVWGSLGWIAYGEREGFAGRLEEQGALFAFRRAPLGVSFAGCLGTAGDPSGRPPLPLRP
jgi:hypothetical protein